MIERTGSGFIINCDSCSSTEEYDESNWHDMIAFIKDLGWSVRKVEDEQEHLWLHICPSCVEAEREAS